MKKDKIKTWFQKAIISNIENLSAKEQDYAKTIAEYFIFHGDDVTCNFKQWVARLHTFKSKMKSLKVIFEYVIVEGETVAANYWVIGVKHDGSEMLTKIIAFFKVENNKLVYCDELTRTMKGHLHTVGKDFH